ncbi:hypothetical protein GQ607_001515 [Colletotrichum asianum]|uniref:Uncharacterized protein n=1 Tax=Colletotrichum asianum TaxID=702518 RepID=A0A8H3ZWU9_9PEZI|nr:hypothetical protein GQ607_001515 [Colletotrichum asianum]
MLFQQAVVFASMALGVSAVCQSVSTMCKGKGGLEARFDQGWICASDMELPCLTGCIANPNKNETQGVTGVVKCCKPCMW